MTAFRKAAILQTAGFAALLLAIAGCQPIDATPSPADGMVSIAGRLHAQGDDEGAVDFYDRALQRNPGDLAAAKGLGAIFEAHGNNDKAAAAYRMGLGIAPNDGELHRDYGRVLIKMKRLADAREQYEEALKIDPDDIKAMNGLGITLDYLGNHDAAQAQYKNALDAQSGDFTTLNNLGHSYVLAGNYDAAIKLLEPEAQDFKAPASLRQNLAEAYAMKGMDADALRVARVDLTARQAAHNLDYYRMKRAKMKLPPALYVNLGSFSTHALAAGRADIARDKFSDLLDGLKLAVTPVVRKQGGTPDFFVRVSGFADAGKARSFCDALQKQDFTCVVHRD